jgi:hypothetical protein
MDRCKSHIAMSDNSICEYEIVTVQVSKLKLEDSGLGWDIVRRPATCTDNLCHVFTVENERNSMLSAPPCGKDVAYSRSPANEDEFCELCSTAATSWAQGGTLKVGQA